MNLYAKTVVFIFCFYISFSQYSFSQRLFLDDHRINSLKNAICVEGSHHQQLFNQILKRVDANDLKAYGSDNINYRRSYCAVENALVFKLTNDTAYAHQAFKHLSAMYDTSESDIPTIPVLGDQASFIPGSKALNHTFPGLAYAICFDWLKQAWDSTKIKFVKDTLIEGLNDWEQLFRWELFNMPNSNWVSVCRGTELIMMLAAEEENLRSQRFDSLKYLLRLHFDLAYGPGGYTNEGLSYLNYGVPFSYAAMAALRSIGDHSLDSSLYRPFDKLFMYAFTSSDEVIQIQTSVDSHYPSGEGMFGLVFQNLSGENLSHYKHFYDHLLGIESHLPIDKRFDQKRLGAVWNLIFYPENALAKTPDRSYSPVYTDESYGAFFFRNNWTNNESILFNVMGKTHSDEKGWQDAETFNFGLIAFGNRFFGSAGKNQETDDYSSLIIDGKANLSHKHSGELENVTTFTRGGYIVLNGGEKYSALETEAKRHAYVDFLGDSLGIIFILDQLNSVSTHTYRWQGNVGHEDGNCNLTAQTGKENGLSCFLLKGENHAYVKGWLLNDSSVNFKGSDPLYLNFREVTEQNIWVMMLVGKGQVHAVRFSGNGMDKKIFFGRYEYYFDPLKNEIVRKDIR